MNDFVNVIRKDPKVQIKKCNMLDRYNRSPPKYQSIIGYGTLNQNVFLRDLLNIMGTTITDLDIGLKMKVSRRECFESKTNSQIYKESCNQHFRESPFHDCLLYK